MRDTSLVCHRKSSGNSHSRQGSDWIKSKHNSNHKTQQITLRREIVQEYIFYVLGFVSADIVKLKKDVWFSKLSNEQIKSVETSLGSKKFVLE